MVVVGFGSHDLLARNLAATTLHTPGLSVCVVDNLSTAAEREQVVSLGEEHRWRVVTPDANLGFGAGCNLGVATLPEAVDVVLLLNPDATLGPADLAALVETARAQPDTLVAPRLVRVDGSQASWGSDLLLGTGEMRGWHRRPADADPASYQPWLSGACLALSRQLWQRIDGFDEDYFLYWEDVDLSRRVLASGGGLLLLETATAVHDEGATHRVETPARAKSPTYYYWNARNRLLFAHKHLAEAEQRRWWRRSPGVGYRLLLQGGRRQLRRPGRTIVPVLRGIADGRRLLRG